MSANESNEGGQGKDNIYQRRGPPTKSGVAEEVRGLRPTDDESTQEASPASGENQSTQESDDAEIIDNVFWEETRAWRRYRAAEEPDETPMLPEEPE